jgi:ABC-type transport system involved in Fe-S cluster assembly fused permease/ATPase subunit
VRDADLILVLEEGRIVARGRHDQLVHEPGYYRDVWRRQQEEHALEGEAEELR